MTDTDNSQHKRRKVQVRYYRFQNYLKAKASTGFGSGGPGKISKEALEKAEAEFEKMAEDYPDWVQGYLRRLTEFHSRCVDTPENRDKHFKGLSELAHDLKGQGGTFGYPLISRFGESLYNFTTYHDGYIEDNHVEIVKAHIDSMKNVIAHRIAGEGGAVGKELIATLEAVIKKYTEFVPDR